MAEFARDPPRAGHRAAAGHEGRGDARADGDEDEGVAAPAGAEAGLGEAAGPDVVAERDREAEVFGQSVADRDVVPIQVDRSDHRAGGLVDQAGCDDSGGPGRGSGVPGEVREFGGEAEHGVDDGPGAACGPGGPRGLCGPRGPGGPGGPALGPDDRAVLRDDGTLEFGAADVQGDDGHGWSRMIERVRLRG